MYHHDSVNSVANHPHSPRAISFQVAQKSTRAKFDERCRITFQPPITDDGLALYGTSVDRVDRSRIVWTPKTGNEIDRISLPDKMRLKELKLHGTQSMALCRNTSFGKGCNYHTNKKDSFNFLSEYKSDSLNEYKSNFDEEKESPNKYSECQSEDTVVDCVRANMAIFEKDPMKTFKMMINSFQVMRQHRETTSRKLGL